MKKNLRALIRLYSAEVGGRKFPYKGENIMSGLQFSLRDNSSHYSVKLVPEIGNEIPLEQDTNVTMHFLAEDEVRKKIREHKKFYLCEGRHCVGEGQVIDV